MRAQLPSRAANSAPNARAAIRASLSAVMTAWSVPPVRTFRQLIAVNIAMTRIASGVPSIGKRCPMNVVVPTAYAAIEPGVPIQNRVQP